MSLDAELKERFERVAPPPGDLDWLDVVRRARELERSPRRGRRRALLLAAALVALLALAGSALALTGSTTGVPAIDRLLDRAWPNDVGPGEPRPVVMFAGGGGRYLRLAGFARAEVERVDVSGADVHAPARLSPPWSPEPWNGAPIRFVYVLLDAPAGRLTPGDLFPEDLKIQAHVANGRVVEVRP